MPNNINKDNENKASTIKIAFSDELDKIYELKERISALFTLENSMLFSIVEKDIEITKTEIYGIESFKLDVLSKLIEIEKNLLKISREM